MEVELEDAGPLEKRLSVTVPAKQVEGRLAIAYRELRREIELPGFRKGKVPRKLLEKRFGERVAADVGPELAAKALAKMMKRPIIAHNAAKFGSDDEAAANLFGVAPRVFTNVDARPGLFEKSDKKVLFLDDINNLPKRHQKSLLRVIEEGLVSRIGDTRQRKIEVRCLFAANEPPPRYGLEHDLLARLRVLEIPPPE